MKHFFKFSIITMLLGFYLPNFNAQETVGSFLKNTQISGYADIFYKYDFDNKGTNTKTVFTQPNNSIEPSMFSLKFINTLGKFSATADIGFGNKNLEVGNNNTKLLLKELYVDYNPLENLQFTIGSWESHIGYEYYDAPDNDIYSMSYAFSYGPFFHTGLKGKYTFHKFNIMAGIENPTDLKSAFQQIPVLDNNGNVISRNSYNNKYFIWQLGYTSDLLKLYINGQQGSNNPLDSNISQFDFVGSVQATEQFKIGFNTTFVTTTYDNSTDKKNWSSYVGYLKYQFTDHITLNYRSEFLNNKDGVLTLGQTNGNTVFANTLSANFSYFNIHIKPEIRLEQSNQKIYSDFHGNPINHSANVLVGVLYNF